MHLPNGWEFDDTLANDNSVSFSGELSYGSILLIETDDPNTFPTNSPSAEMTLMTYLVNQFLLEAGGHVLAEPNIIERDDGVIAVYSLAEDGFGITRWSAIYLFENGNVVIAQVSHIGAATFPRARNQLLAIVLSVEFSSRGTTGSRPSG
jgi:hypothetical protein